MTIRDVILDYLSYTQTKSSTMVGISILTQQLGVEPKDMASIIFDMYTEGLVDLIGLDNNDLDLHLIEVKLIPKFKILS